MQRYNDLVVSIDGYTDSKGDEHYNQTLSSSRAKAVMNAIIAEGIDASRLSFKGHGEDNPIASNDTDEGRAKNRRVELHKISGGNTQQVIDISFIKPLPNAVQTQKRGYDNHSLTVEFTPPFSKKKTHQKHTGHLETIRYDIMNQGKIDKHVSRKAIIKNYENVLELYNAKVVGINDGQLWFVIDNRGDGKKVYGRIDGYDGYYAVFMLIKN